MWDIPITSKQLKELLEESVKIVTKEATRTAIRTAAVTFAVEKVKEKMAKVASEEEAKATIFTKFINIIEKITKRGSMAAITRKSIIRNILKILDPVGLSIDAAQAWIYYKGYKNISKVLGAIAHVRSILTAESIRRALLVKLIEFGFWGIEKILVPNHQAKMNTSKSATEMLAKATNPVGSVSDISQSGLEVAGYKKTGKAVGAIGNVISGAMTGFACGGPYGAVAGGIAGFAVWTLGEGVGMLTSKLLGTRKEDI